MALTIPEEVPPHQKLRDLITPIPTSEAQTEVCNTGQLKSYAKYYITLNQME